MHVFLNIILFIFYLSCYRRNLYLCAVDNSKCPCSFTAGHAADNKRGNSLSDRPLQAYLGQINYSNSTSECLEKMIDWLILIFKGI